MVFAAQLSDASILKSPLCVPTSAWVVGDEEGVEVVGDSDGADELGDEVGDSDVGEVAGVVFLKIPIVAFSSLTTTASSTTAWLVLLSCSSKRGAANAES